MAGRFKSVDPVGVPPPFRPCETPTGAAVSLLELNMKRMHYNSKARTAWEPDGETWFNVHSRSDCQGRNCVVHNPSNHSLVDFPRHLRETGLVERICPHGIGHPDPDSVIWMNEHAHVGRGTWGVHGCDGCCLAEGIKVTKEGLDLSNA